MENSKSSIFEAFKKSLKVINSCQNKLQLEGARKFVDQFWFTYKEEFNDEYMNSVLMSLYGQLTVKYDEKSQSVSL